MKLQDKVSFEDMKRFMALNGAGANGATTGSQGSLAGRQIEILEDEVRGLKERTEDIFHQVQSLRQMGGGPSSQRDHTSF